jgi:acetyl-CoA carboxylase biotin carboxyl carrier protein
MSLTAADIAEIMRLVENSTFDELSLELDGLKLNFKRGTQGAGTVARSEPAAPPAAAPDAQGMLHSEPPVPKTAADPSLIEVRSPMLGTFYRAPKPGEPPFVTVGATVEQDSIVGIIEVMKLMNTVRAEVRGTVAEIPVADGALVEYGEVLLRVRAPD